MSSQDKNLPYEILTLSDFGFKYCSVKWKINSWDSSLPEKLNTTTLGTGGTSSMGDTFEKSTITCSSLDRNKGLTLVQAKLALPVLAKKTNNLIEKLEYCFNIKRKS